MAATVTPETTRPDARRTGPYRSGKGGRGEAVTYFEEKVAQLGGSLKALNFFPQLLMERKVMFWFLSLSCSVTDFCKHQTLVCVCV